MQGRPTTPTNCLTKSRHTPKAPTPINADAKGEEVLKHEGLIERFGLNEIIPLAEDSDIVASDHSLRACQGDLRKPSRGRYGVIIEGLVSEGAEGIILRSGCSWGMKDSPMPLSDKAKSHAEVAVEWPLGMARL